MEGERKARKGILSFQSKIPTGDQLRAVFLMRFCHLPRDLKLKVTTASRVYCATTSNSRTRITLKGTPDLST